MALHFAAHKLLNAWFAMDTVMDTVNSINARVTSVVAAFFDGTGSILLRLMWWEVDGAQRASVTGSET
jgi:hypothetical protein